MNNLSSVINGLGWMALTYCWLYTNLTFFEAIAQAIEAHKAGLRHRSFNEGYRYGACMQKKESDDDDDDDNGVDES